MDASRRQSFTIGFLMIDIGFFMEINDSYGHQTGDKVIVKIAEVLTNSPRDSDTKARYATADAPSIRLYDVPGRHGGDEFAFILPYCREAEVFLVAERIRKRIGEFAMPDLPGLRIGGMVFDAGTCDNMRDADFMQKTDNALYAAKASGRGKTVIAPRSTSAEKDIGNIPIA